MKTARTYLYDKSEALQEFSYDAWGNLRNPESWIGEASEAPMFDRGFTGHEHLYGFDLINMNGRMYDPVMSSFLSVDNYVQNPENSQNFNRYAYCLNNPLKYTDPSGEVAVVDDIIAAAIVGAIINGFVQTAQGNVQSFGDWCVASLIGGVSGAAGAWAGGAAAGVFGGIGAAGGGLSGAIGGTAGGFVGGTGNAWINGASFGEGLAAGFSGAGMGALTGGLIGGISGGITAARHGGDFWTGKLKPGIYEFLAGGNGTKIETDYNSSLAAKHNDEWLHQKSIDRFEFCVGDMNTSVNTTTLNSENARVVKEYGFASTGQYVNGQGKLVNGFRCVNASGLTEIHISPACLYDDVMFDATMGHELIHVYHHFHLKNVDHIYTERVAHEYSYNVYSSAGYQKMANAELLSAIKLGYGPGVCPAEYIIPSTYPFSVNYIP